MVDLDVLAAPDAGSQSNASITLRRWPDASAASHLEELVHNWYTDLGDSPVGGPLAKAAWRAIQSNLQNLHSSRSLNRLQVTSRPFNMPTTAADGALEKELCTIRWETVGMYFALIGMVITSAKNLSTSFSGR
ncbi:hypothetical protein TARUN_6174 [Trichoderma arundinaceum]|uniref:Uncharacterized protein n=1 Tax=Trichoderma arundinaceum TaxID=490622 RepID=A0A395NJQ3_TRIAR|nr:hypothetical protein TARUN_6174 [Trichoderma arundinaceum]